MERKRVYRPNELKGPYGISRDLAFKLIKDGKLRSFTIGKRQRFITVEAIEEFIRECEAETAMAAHPEGESAPK